MSIFLLKGSPKKENETLKSLIFIILFSGKFGEQFDTVDSSNTLKFYFWDTSEY